MSPDNKHRVIKFREYRLRDVVRVLAGGLILIIGILGLVFPILNGTLFVIVAAFVLAPYSRIAKRCIEWAERHAPRLVRRVEAWHERCGLGGRNR